MASDRSDMEGDMTGASMLATCDRCGQLPRECECTIRPAPYPSSLGPAHPAHPDHAAAVEEMKRRMDDAPTLVPPAPTCSCTERIAQLEARVSELSHAVYALTHGPQLPRVYR